VPKRKVVPCISNYPYEKFGKISTLGRSPIQISKCGCLKILRNKKMPGPHASLRRRLNGTRMLASRARHSCSAAAATSRQRCRPAATSAPRATHAAAARASSPHAVGSKEKSFSPLPAIAAEHPPTLLCLLPSASAPSSPLLYRRCAAAPQDPLAIAP
jgi:hypothetical protein